MKTTNAVNKYYDDRLKTASLTIKKRLASLENKQSLEYGRMKAKLERKLEIQKKKIEEQRKKKLKSLETGKPVVRKVKEKTNSRYKTKADWYFSRIVRAINCFDSNGVRSNYCCITKKILPLLELQCGHYITRANMITRYHLGNCLPQSPGANQREHLDPKMKKYMRQAIIDAYGEDNIAEVESLNYSTVGVNVKEEYNKRKTIYECNYIKYYE